MKLQEIHLAWGAWPAADEAAHVRAALRGRERDPGRILPLKSPKNVTKSGPSNRGPRAEPWEVLLAKSGRTEGKMRASYTTRRSQNGSRLGKLCPDETAEHPNWEPRTRKPDFPR
ncbi:hypothetical protein NDU88_003363 [Pleurodeles waltl]|uniref:Uncharacterized protein n=1 Tax=Pleurodeles waltl TaxID=8319 RepID=A0AAV7WSM5_PLEWA|nr:hypothetical protein NDU88_003363 [Pleurodeles waltl]